MGGRGGHNAVGASQDGASGPVAGGRAGRGGTGGYYPEPDDGDNGGGTGGVPRDGAAPAQQFAGGRGKGGGGVGGLTDDPPDNSMA